MRRFSEERLGVFSSLAQAQAVEISTIACAVGQVHFCWRSGRLLLLPFFGFRHSLVEVKMYMLTPNGQKRRNKRPVCEIGKFT